MVAFPPCCCGRHSGPPWQRPWSLLYLGAAERQGNLHLGVQWGFRRTPELFCDLAPPLHVALRLPHQPSPPFSAGRAGSPPTGAGVRAQRPALLPDLLAGVLNG